VFFAFLVISQTYAEKAPIKFGKVSMEEMEMKTYLPDTTASAVILCDYGLTNIPFSNLDERFQKTFERTVRIKILKKEGLDFANFVIMLYSRGERITNIKGMTYNLENGKIIKTKLKSDGKFLEYNSKYISSHKVALPNVKVGSVIEYSYSTRSDYFYTPRTWYFQQNIPVKWSEYRVNIPKYFHFKLLSKGYLNFDINDIDYGTGSFFNIESFSIKKYRWAVSEAPAFKEEPYMTAAHNFLSAIEFELGGIREYKGIFRNYTYSWEKINERLLENDSFGQQLKGGGFLKDIAAKINSEAKTEEDKMIKAYHFIKKHMTWNNYSSIYTNSSLRKAFKEKKGNVAEINLMLVLLLNELKLNSDPLILSTRQNGMVSPAQINISKFNYVVAKTNINDREYLLDATEFLCPTKILPFRCMNGQGRLISKRGSKWINLNNKTPHKHVISSKLKLNKEGALIGVISDSHQGHAALSERNKYEDKSEDEIKISIEENNQGLIVENLEIFNLKDTEKALQKKLDVEIVDKVEDTGNLIYLNPMLYEQTKKNPFTLEERKYPVDYGHAYDETYTVEISLPEGCCLESKPENMRIALPNKAGSYIYSIQILGGKIILMSRLRIIKPMFSFDEYPSLKEFYKLIVAKQAEMLVLKRNS